MKAPTIAHAKTVGYILLIHLLYQLSNRPILPKKRVHPEQKKNKASPIAPPVAKSLKSPYSNFMGELVIDSAVIHSVYLY